MRKRIDWWSIFFSVFFIYLMYLAYRVVLIDGGQPQHISLWDASLMALASFRLTRLIVYDTITAWFRDFFEDGEPFTLVGTVKTLINCPWCMGLWFSLLVATAYFTSPFLWFFIFVLALGGAATLIQLITNWIGWNAEYQKRKTLDKYGK